MIGALMAGPFGLAGLHETAGHVSRREPAVTVPPHHLTAVYHSRLSTSVHPAKTRAAPQTGQIAVALTPCQTTTVCGAGRKASLPPCTHPSTAPQSASRQRQADRAIQGSVLSALVT